MKWLKRNWLRVFLVVYIIVGSAFVMAFARTLTSVEGALVVLLWTVSLFVVVSAYQWYSVAMMDDDEMQEFADKHETMISRNDLSWLMLVMWPVAVVRVLIDAMRDGNNRLLIMMVLFALLLAALAVVFTILLGG